MSLLSHRQHKISATDDTGRIEDDIRTAMEQSVFMGDMQIWRDIKDVIGTAEMRRMAHITPGKLALKAHGTTLTNTL